MSEFTPPAPEEVARLPGSVATHPSPVRSANQIGSGPVNDADLLERVGAGEGEAWETLISRYERLIYSVALRNGLPATDAMDVTQSTFMILLESHSKLRSHESLASWLMTVARRQSWRVRQHNRQEVLTAGLAPEPEDEPGIDWEQSVTVHTALDQLGNPCRELLIALYFDQSEPTYTAIARRLGRSIGGIGPLRARCLAKLRTLLEDIQ